MARQKEPVLYLTGSVGASTFKHLDEGTIGFMNTPNIGNRLGDWVWAADNGCYSGNYVGDEKWLAWLDSFTPEQRSRCLFAVAPDVVGDSGATLTRSRPWLWQLRWLGYSPAFVAQDGLTDETIPWDEFDVLFIGGTTKWKMGATVRGLIAEAKRRDKLVHIGRVNSQFRYLAFAAMGCDTADGTYLAFGPDTNTPKLLSWIRKHKEQTKLF